VISSGLKDAMNGFNLFVIKTIYYKIDVDNEGRKCSGKRMGSVQIIKGGWQDG